MTSRSVLLRAFTAFAVATTPVLAVTTAPAPVTAVSSSAHRSFISSVASSAKDVEKSSGLPASVIIAAAIQASNWGKASEAKKGKNYFDAPCGASLTPKSFAKTADAQVGKPYVLGAETTPYETNPKSFDCSELVEWLYARSGTKVTDLAASQYEVTQRVSGSPKVGDLVFLRNNPARWNGIGHVAVLSKKMANGDWRVIEARGKAWGVVRSTLSNWRSRSTYAGLRRYSPLLLANQSGIALTPNTYRYQVGCMSVTTSSGKIVKYRKYSSVADSFADFGVRMRASAAFRKAVSGAWSVDKYADAVAAQMSPKSASAYASSLKQLIRDYRLTAYDTVPLRTVLLRGDAGEKVTALQYLLSAAGFNPGMSGRYDAATSAAVTSLQRRYSLEVDGEAGPEVFSKLLTTTQASSNSARITAANVLLRMHGYSISNTRTFGSATTNAVKSFQTRTGLAITGKVTRNTWVKLFMAVQPSAKPTITGRAAVDATLKAAPGTWSPGSVRLSFQWYRGAAVIAGATSASYTVRPSDVGQRLSYKVTGTKNGYLSVSRTSAATSAVVLAGFSSSPSPAVSGTAQVGQALTVSSAGWAPAPASVSYQWNRGGKAIPGATGTRYVVTAADMGASLTVTSTARRTGYQSLTRTSAATSKVTAGTLTAPTPTIAGTAKVGKKLSARAGSWFPAASLSYQWYRGATKISGATSASYTLKAGDKGKVVTVRVTGRKAGYTTKTVTSKATAKVTA